MIIFVPCRTKRQVERVAEQDTERNQSLAAVRGVRLETECLAYGADSG
jgi:hypothetical protein